VLKLTEMEISNGVLTVCFEGSCNIFGRVHFSTPGAAIPVSLTSNYTARVSVRGRSTAKITFSGLTASVADLHVPSFEALISDIRWGHQGLDLLRDSIQAAVFDRLRDEQPSALRKLNEELSGLEFSKSLLDIP